MLSQGKAIDSAIALFPPTIDDRTLSLPSARTLFGGLGCQQAIPLVRSTLESSCFALHIALYFHDGNAYILDDGDDREW